MPWFVWAGIVGYGIGWLLFVAVNEPDDAVEGFLFLVAGILWPLHFLGWLVSRPFA